MTRSTDSVRSFWTPEKLALRKNNVTAKGENTDVPGVAVSQILRREVQVCHYSMKPCSCLFGKFTECRYRDNRAIYTRKNKTRLT